MFVNNGKLTQPALQMWKLQHHFNFTHGGQLSPSRNFEDTMQDVDVGEWLSAHELNIYYSHVIDPGHCYNLIWGTCGKDPFSIHR